MDVKISGDYKKHIVLFAMFIVALLRILTSSNSYSNGDKLLIASKVMTEPVQYEYSQGFRLEGIWVFLPPFPVVFYGDSVVVSGYVEDDVLRDAKLLEHTESKNVLYKIRKQIISFYEHSLPSPYNALVAGMVLGSKGLMPRDFWDVLKETGTAHVVVASGMNITLVAGSVTSILLTIFARKKAIVGAFIGIWLYALLSGFDAPVIRAALMGTLGFLSVGLGRVKMAWRIVLLTFFVMVIVSPAWIYDVGFILSFTATIGLMLFEKPIRKRLEIVPRFVREDLSTSLAAQIGVFPVLIFVFGRVSLLGPFVNALILWTVVPITVIGGISGMLSLIFPFVARLILYSIYPLTWFFVQIVEVFA